MAAARLFLLVLPATALAAVLAAAVNDALAHSDSCPNGQHATRMGNACVETRYLGFADWCEAKGGTLRQNGQSCDGAGLGGPSWCRPFRFDRIVAMPPSPFPVCTPGSPFMYSDGSCMLPATDSNSYNPATHACTVECQSGFTEDPQGMCQADRDCAAENRAQTNAYTCGACLPAFTADPQGACQAHRDCALDNRVQTNPYACGDCRSGFTADPQGMCQAHRDCAAENRAQTNPYACGACRSGLTESSGACNCPDGNAPGPYRDCNTPRLTDQTACEETPTVNPIGGTWEFGGCTFPDAHFHGAAPACIPAVFSCADHVYPVIREQACDAKGLLFKSLGSNLGVENFCICPTTGEQSTDSCPDLATSDPVPISVFISTSANGTVSAEWAGDSELQNEETVPLGTTVTFTAEPASGYGFSAWSGACQGEANPCVLGVTVQATVGADFVYTGEYTGACAVSRFAEGIRGRVSLQIAACDATGWGVVELNAGFGIFVCYCGIEARDESSDQLSCSNAASSSRLGPGANQGNTNAAFHFGENLEHLPQKTEANKDACFVSHCTGGKEPSGFNMNGETECVAPPTDSVSVFISASTNGTVSAEWAGDSDLQSGETVPSGTTVTFTASPDNGYELARWTGDCLGDSVEDSQCALAVTMEVTVGAEFELLFFEVSLAASDNGTVSAGWQGDANLQSGEEVSFGATVTFTATPADGYELTLWTGACMGEAVDSPCVLEVMMNATVGAGFGCLDFHESAAAGNLAGLKCNVDAGADVNAPDESGKTPLHLAAGEGHLEAVQKLLTLGATLNASDDDGDTPLTEAAENDNVEIFNLLAMEGGTHEGAECGPGEVPNPNGKTPPCESCEADEIVSNGVCESCGRNEVASGGACECASGYEAIGGTCIHPENRLPEDETTCADAFGGDWVDLSAEHGEGKGVCSGIDINDTFCLAGTGSALPCLGLFNHVRSCNLLGRPALDPWHCAAACAGGKAAGARCLE